MTFRKGAPLVASPLAVSPALREPSAEVADIIERL